MNLKILTDKLIDDFTKTVKKNPLNILENIEIQKDISIDYFQFYNSVSSVYSSKIEGENIDFDSFYKHKFLNIRYKGDYTNKADDLFNAYTFAFDKILNLSNIKKAHAILSSNLLPKEYQGKIRKNPMFVINNNDRIEYVAANPEKIDTELKKLFEDIQTLQKNDLNPFEIFYFASLIHLVFVKIHPFQDGNGRTARLAEHWFLKNKIDDKAYLVQLEKNYYNNINEYYANIKKLGLEYDELNYNYSTDFLLMTIKSLINKQ